MTADVEVRAHAERPWRRRMAPAALVVGGLAMATLFVPFTLAHGPTSFNEEREVLGWDMHAWGFLMGVLPGVLIAGGLWRLHQPITGGRRGATLALAVGGVALLLDALMNLAFRALGPPFVLLLLGPAMLALAVLVPPDGAGRRAVVAALGFVLAAGFVLALLPQEASDAHGGYRIYGAVVYGLGGLLWALLGATLRRRVA